MNIKKYMGLAAIMLPLAATSQTAIDFETEGQGYTKLGVYDSWENSPFRDGRLEGNVRVVKNHLTESDPIIGDINPSSRILGFQRSRFASNVFGARIDLAEPFEMSSTTRYVHVMIYKQTSGRVMLVGLGKRQDRPSQKPEVEQFNVLSTSTVRAGKWYDAVFPISGTAGVDIHSLVVVPECEPTHNMTADEIVYIDNIEINNSSRPRITYGFYPINFEKTEKLTRTDRYTNSISLSSPSGGAKTITVDQQTNKLVYADALSESFQVKAGETVKPSIGYNSTWMHGYVYLDRNNDGKFQYELNEDLTMPADCELMSYSCYKDKNSAGESVTGAINNTNAAVQPPSFTIPSDLTPGFYRLRYKVDWDNIDPAGASTSGNTIVSNGGIFVDTRLNVHGDEVQLTRGQHAQGTNGEVKTEDGENWPSTIPFGQPFTFKVVPSPGFKFSHAIIRHGYNLAGDSLVNETPQYEELTVPAYAFKDNTYTLPAKYVDGNVQITVVFPADEGGTTPSGEDYPLNFDEGLLIDRTGKDDRRITALAVAGKTLSVSNDPYTVYKDMTDKEVNVTPGQSITISPTGTSNYYMHAYFYVDLNQDGQFDTSLNADNGQPTMNGEMLGYSYYNGINSAGQTSNINAPNLIQQMPAVTIPDYLPAGNYRARFKVDWDDIDPAGHWSADGRNKINENGGYIIDFLLNVSDGSEKLDVQTTNGSLVGANNSGVSNNVTVGSALTLLPVGLDEGYQAEKIVIRHGHDLDGEQYIHGNRQWSEYSVAADGAYTIPADSVNGDLRISADFTNVSSEYNLVFADEFDGADGSQPNADIWSRSGWAHPVWKRFTAQTPAGQAKTGYIEDGKLVMRCLANPFDNEVDGSGNKLQMISGAVETAGKLSFTYGKVEGRIRTLGQSGSFPAFWMMPQNEVKGWPFDGEIDIWEQIDSETQTHHTIHSGWANGSGDGGLGQNNNPAKTGNGTATIGDYHILGLEWTENLLTWYLDGKEVFSYAKSSSQSDLDNGQWPFDNQFYLILNQSVGNGDWAAAPDPATVYETFFDWVRVYQKEGGDITGLADASADTFRFYVAPGSVRLVATAETLVQIVDLQGRTLFRETVQGNRTVALPQGVYVLNGHKVLVP